MASDISEGESCAAGLSSGTRCAIAAPLPNLWVLDPPILSYPFEKIHSDEVYDLLHERNSIHYAEVIKWGASQLGIEPENAFLLLDNDPTTALFLAAQLKPELSLFYRNEKPVTGTHSAQRAERLEAEASRRADIVLTNNVAVGAKLRQYNPNTYNIGKGIDLSAYQLDKDYQRPADIADIDTKIIGCAGTISSLYLSPSLVHKLSLDFPETTVVLLGKKDPLVGNHPLHTLPNVRFVGAKSYEELPAYIAAFDVCIDPAINKHPNSRYRNAVINYLALGKSVICNNLPHIQQFCDYVMTADTEKEFTEKVSWALNTRLPWSIRYKRAEFAHTFSWTKCVERMYVVIFMVESGRMAKERDEGNRKQHLC